MDERNQRAAKKRRFEFVGVWVGGSKKLKKKKEVGLGGHVLGFDWR